MEKSPKICWNNLKNLQESYKNVKKSLKFSQIYWKWPKNLKKSSIIHWQSQYSAIKHAKISQKNLLKWPKKMSKNVYNYPKSIENDPKTSLNPLRRRRRFNSVGQWIIVEMFHSDWKRRKRALDGSPLNFFSFFPPRPVSAV